MRMEATIEATGGRLFAGDTQGCGGVALQPAPHSFARRGNRDRVLVDAGHPLVRRTHPGTTTSASPWRRPPCGRSCVPAGIDPAPRRTITAADPIPDDLRDALDAINGTR